MVRIGVFVVKTALVGAVIYGFFRFGPVFVTQGSTTSIAAFIGLVLLNFVPLLLGGAVAALLDHLWAPSGRAWQIAALGAFVAALSLGVVEPPESPGFVGSIINTLILMPSVALLAALAVQGVLSLVSPRR